MDQWHGADRAPPALLLDLTVRFDEGYGISWVTPVRVNIREDHDSVKAVLSRLLQSCKLRRAPSLRTSSYSLK